MENASPIKTPGSSRSKKRKQRKKASASSPAVNPLENLFAKLNIEDPLGASFSGDLNSGSFASACLPGNILFSPAYFAPGGLQEGEILELRKDTTLLYIGSARPHLGVELGRLVIPDVIAQGLDFANGGRYDGIMAQRYTGALSYVSRARVSAVGSLGVKASDLSAVASGSLPGMYIWPGLKMQMSVVGLDRAIKISAVSPVGAEKPAIVTYDTVFTVEGVEAASTTPNSAQVNLGGLDDEKRFVQGYMADYVQDAPDRWSLGGLLMHGNSGTGKNQLVRSCAFFCGLALVEAEPGDFLGMYEEEIESNVAAVFQRVREVAPAVLLLPDIDSVFPAQNDGGEVDSGLLSSLFAQHVKTVRGDNVPLCLVGTTDRLAALDPRIRSESLFNVELEIAIPTRSMRCSVLASLLESAPHSVSTLQIRSLAERAHGFTGADLYAAICKAGWIVLRRLQSSNGGDASGGINFADLETALSCTVPSAMREVVVEVPSVRWEDVGGYESTKLSLKQCTEWPIKYPVAFRRMAVPAGGGVLLYGPPGCSKTLLAKALAHEAQLNFLAVRGPEVFTKYVGESERTVRELFRRARACSPSIVFIDEVDAICSARLSSGSDVSSRVVATLLSELDRSKDSAGVTVVAATNSPGLIDKALLRPGRLDSLIYVPPPDHNTRLGILTVATRNVPLNEDVDLTSLAGEHTKMFSGAELVSCVQKAGIIALKESIESQNISARHFHEACRHIHPRISSEMLRYYTEFRDAASV